VVSIHHRNYPNARSFESQAARPAVHLHRLSAPIQDHRKRQRPEAVWTRKDQAAPARSPRALLREGDEFMEPDEKDQKQDLRDIFDNEHSAELIGEIFNSDTTDPEGFIRALLPIFDLSRDGAVIDAVGNLMRAAYNKSVVADDSFDQYLSKLRGERPEAKTTQVPPTVDFLAYLFTTAKEVFERGDREEMRLFRQTLKTLCAETPGSSPDLASGAKAENRKVKEEQETDHFCELLNEHSTEPRIRARLIEVLESRTDDEPTAEVIEIVEGESFIFTDSDGTPVVWLSFDTEGQPTVEFNRASKPAPAPASPRPARVAEPSDARRRNVMELGEHLCAILENPETPVAIHNEIADALNDLGNDASMGIAADARRNWPHIAEYLLSNTEKGGDGR
jgi:hypothetical protein